MLGHCLACLPTLPLLSLLRPCQVFLGWPGQNDPEAEEDKVGGGGEATSAPPRGDFPPPGHGHAAPGGGGLPGASAPGPLGELEEDWRQAGQAYGV